MEINYYISEKDFKNTVQTITRKQKFYIEGIFQLFVLTYWVWNFLLDEDRNQHLLLSITITTVAWLLTVLFTHYLFHSLQPKLIVRRNQNAIKNVSLVLQEEVILLVSNANSKYYKKKKVLKVRELETAYCIIFPRNFFIVIPKISGLNDADEQGYSNRLEMLVEEIKRSSKQRFTK